jgi:hypothetical protein
VPTYNASRGGLQKDCGFVRSVVVDRAFACGVQHDVGTVAIAAPRSGNVGASGHSFRPFLAVLGVIASFAASAVARDMHLFLVEDAKSEGSPA